MKTIVLLTLLISGQAFAQLGVNWNSEISVSDGSVYGYLRPRMVLTANDVPVIAYGNSVGLYVSRWNGTGFDTPVSLLPAGMEQYMSGWTGADIASKGDTVIVVFKEQPLTAGHVYSVRSTDGGVTFSDTIRVDNHTSGVAWMPSLDMDEFGNPVVSYMIHDDWANPRYVLAQSADVGLTYDTEIEVITALPGETCDCCPSEMVIDGARRVLLFRNNESNLRDIYGVLSNDGGVTYPYQTNVDNTGWIINACPSTGPHGVFNNNELLTVFTSKATGTNRVNISVSDVSGGLSYATIYSLNDAEMSQNYPRISQSNDTTVMAWQGTATTGSDVYVSVVTGGDYGQLLSDATIANAGQTGAQSNPDVIIKNGVVYYCFQDAGTTSVNFKTGTIQSVASQNELEDFSNLLISPNPSSTGVYTLNTGAYRNVEVYNQLGEKVSFSIATDGSFSTISLDRQQAGIYQLRVVLKDDSIQNFKLLLNK